jgi:hypothetical protein
MFKVCSSFSHSQCCIIKIIKIAYNFGNYNFVSFGDSSEAQTKYVLPATDCVPTVKKPMFIHL